MVFVSYGKCAFAFNDLLCSMEVADDLQVLEVADAIVLLVQLYISAIPWNHI